MGKGGLVVETLHLQRLYFCRIYSWYDHGSSPVRTFAPLRTLREAHILHLSLQTSNATISLQRDSKTIDNIKGKVLWQAKKAIALLSN